MIAITINQGGSRNWAAGSEKWSLSLGTILNVFANKQMGKWSWNNSLDMAYAFLNTESDGYTKTDDKIYFVSKFGRELKPKLNLTILLNYRSQFYDGYENDYLGQPGLKRRTSGFMAPAYVTLFVPGRSDSRQCERPKHRRLREAKIGFVRCRPRPGGAY
jgi:hypothetical protein